uniref:Exostosin GT47 domain-containing protein n=1 Tax=Kalanchoe fedtschenkoi TaxID=63787 RepID=A0A7N0VE48_KALFE
MLAKRRLTFKLMFCLASAPMFILLVPSLLHLKPNPLIHKPAFHQTTSASLRLRSEKITLPLRPAGSGDAPNVPLNRCDPDQALLKVFMYDLPPEFHFGLLHWKGGPNQTWPDVTDPNRIPSYSGGLNIQHSVEYWLTLDLLSSAAPHASRPCTATRVANAGEADVVFVPFFSSMSYNKCHKFRARGEQVCADKLLQRRLVAFLEGRDEWRRRNGGDHLIAAHHPNSMSEARARLSSAMFVLADFGRYPAEIANIDKDVIAPYKHFVESTPAAESAPFDKRPTLLYFQGKINRKEGGAIRLQLYHMLKDEPDVHFKFGTARGKGGRLAAQGMASSKFCLSVAGDTPSSNRLFDAIASHCVPVIVSDEIKLPFEDQLNYAEFSLRVGAGDALKEGHILNLLRRIKRDEWTRMWERLKRVGRYFVYEFPSRRGDAVEMIWREVRLRASSSSRGISKSYWYASS